MKRDKKGKNTAQTVAKSDLPQKVCPVCERPFSWRKKWERDWETVIYCSDACKKGKKTKSA